MPTKKQARKKLDVTGLAKHFDLSKQAMHRAVRKHGLRPDRRGLFDLQVVEDALYGLSGTATCDEDGLREALRRKAVALARLREIEVAEKEGSLVDIQFVVRTEAKVSAVMRSVILALPSKLVGLVAADVKAAALIVGEEARDKLLIELEAATHVMLPDDKQGLELRLCNRCEKQVEKLIAKYVASEGNRDDTRKS